MKSLLLLSAFIMSCTVAWGKPTIPVQDMIDGIDEYDVFYAILDDIQYGDEPISHDVSPTAYVNIDSMDKIINLTPVREKGAFSCPQIETDVYENGFYVSNQDSGFISGGLAYGTWFPQDEIWNAVGLSVSKSKVAQTYSQFVPTKEDVKKARKRQIPRKADIFLNQYSITDSAYWESMGGMALYIGAGHEGYGLNNLYVVQGGWSHFVLKTGPKKAYVEVGNKKVFSWSASASVGQAQIGIQGMRDRTKGFAYEVELVDDKAEEAFERMMNGDLTKVQELANVTGSGITKLADTSDAYNGFGWGYGFFTPFFPIISYQVNREYQNVDHFEENIWNEENGKQYGAYVKSNTYRAGFGLHRQITQAFTAGREVVNSVNEEGDKINKEILFGRFDYSFEADHGGETRLKEQVYGLQKMTGLYDNLCVRIPNVPGRIGYHQVEFELKWSDVFMRKILMIDEDGFDFFNKIEKTALNVLDSYFGSRSSAGEMEYDGELCRFQSGIVAEPVCKLFHKVEIKNTLRKLKKISVEARIAYAAEDKDKLGKEFADFGRIIWHNPILFKAFYEKAKACGQQLTYEVSGERLTRHQKVERYPVTEECNL